MKTNVEETLFFDTYRRLPLRIDRADGMYLYGRDGTRYLDMFAGIGVNALGHTHPDILNAITAQMSRHLHLSNYFLQDAQVELARIILRSSGYEKVFLANSGTEAVEGAIKIARRHGAASGKHMIVSFTNSYHGRTLGALSLMDRASYREGFGPFLEGCATLPFNDPSALSDGIGHDTAAVFLEFIQGEGGVVPANQRFVDGIEALRKQYGFLLVADEIQCGLGRTGSLFAFDRHGVRPDVVLLAKSLGGGLPLGAILGNAGVAGLLGPGAHGSTFGGNALACAAGAVVLRALSDGGLLKNVATMGTLLLHELELLKKDFPNLIRDVRGHGLMLGVELFTEASPFVQALMAQGVLVNATAKKVLRIIPPLNIGREHLNQFTAAMRTVLTERPAVVSGIDRE